MPSTLLASWIGYMGASYGNLCRHLCNATPFTALSSWTSSDASANHVSDVSNCFSYVSCCCPDLYFIIHLRTWCPIYLCGMNSARVSSLSVDHTAEISKAYVTGIDMAIFYNGNHIKAKTNVVPTTTARAVIRRANTGEIQSSRRPE